jgi:hypothetical protein
MHLLYISLFTLALSGALLLYATHIAAQIANYNPSEQLNQTQQRMQRFANIYS